MTAATLNDLTDRQRQAREFIADYRDRNGYGPTVREVGAALGIVSTEGVMCHLRALRRKGVATWENGRSRTLRVIGGEAGGLHQLFDRCRRLPAGRYAEAAAALDSILERTEGHE